MGDEASASSLGHVLTTRQVDDLSTTRIDIVVATSGSGTLGGGGVI